MSDDEPELLFFDTFAHDVTQEVVQLFPCRRKEHLKTADLNNFVFFCVITDAESGLGAIHAARLHHRDPNYSVGGPGPVGFVVLHTLGCNESVQVSCGFLR